MAIFRFQFGKAFISLTIAVFLACATSAFSFDAETFFNRIKTQLEAKGNIVSFGSLEAVGTDGASLRDVKILKKDNNGSATIDRLDLTGASPIGENDFNFKTMIASGITVVNLAINGNTLNISIREINVTDFNLPNIATSKNPLWPLDLGSVKINGVAVAVSGKDIFNIEVPLIEIAELTAGEGNNFKLGSFNLDQTNGGFAGENGASASFSLGAISLTGLHHFGLTGLELAALLIEPGNSSGQLEDSQSFSFSTGKITGSNVYYPDIDSSDGPLYSQKDMDFLFDGLEFSLNDKRLVSLGRVDGLSQYDPVTQIYTGGANILDLLINFKNLPLAAGGEDGRMKLAGLGYETLTMDYETQGQWNLANGDLSITKLLLNIDDAAAIDIKMKITGYTEEIARTIQHISSQMRKDPTPEKQQLAIAQLIGLASSLKFNSAEIKASNYSLINRVIAMQAEKMGQEAGQFASSLPFMAGAMLPQIGLEKFAEPVVKAITSFLQENGSMTLIAKPITPIGISELIQLNTAIQSGEMKPEALADRLNLQITGK